MKLLDKLLGRKPPPAPALISLYNGEPQLRRDESAIALFTLKSAKGISRGNAYHSVAFSQLNDIYTLFLANPVLHGIISRMAEDFMAMPIIAVTKKGKPVNDSHPANALLEQWQPCDSGFLRDIFIDYLLYGSCFAEIEKDNKLHPMTSDNPDAPGALWRIAPTQVTVEWDDEKRIMPSGIRLTADYATKFPIAPSGKCDLFFVCGYNPVQTRGGAWATPSYPALQAALAFNAMLVHNRKMAENFYRPLAFLMLDKDDRQTPEQMKQMQEMIDERWRNKSSELGGGNSPIIARGYGLEKLGESNKEANFIETLDSLTRIIAMSFHFPPQYLGNAETSQSRNSYEARRTYYDACILPKAGVLLRRLQESIRLHLPVSQRDFQFQIDLNRIPALQQHRGELARLLQGIDFMTADEKRKELGLPESGEAHAKKLQDPNATPPGGKPDPKGTSGNPPAPKDKPNNNPSESERGGSGRS